MSKKAHETALPKLRFPEFQGKEAWEEKKLGELTHPISERNKKDKKLPVYSISNINGFVPQSSQFEGVDSHARGYDITLYKIVGKNTFAYNPARINVGSIGYSGELNEVLISSLYVCFKTNDNLNDLFLWHFIKSAAFNQAVNDTVEGGIRSYLFYENLATIKIHIPFLLEQQKIAAALSSLDALLTAQTAKLTALQAHKRGLMQDLFPAEGETVPKRRFPEFRDAGEWVEKKLGDVATFLNGRAYQQAELLESGKYKVLRLGNLFSNNHWYYSDLGLEENKYCDNCDLLYAWSASFGPRMWTGEKVIYHYHIWKVLEKKGVGKPFLFILLENETNKIKNAQANGLGMLHITKGSIEAWKSLIPRGEEEQQKIANCISSLDNLITAQSQKIEALKLHKKGLMQALFPAASEPNA